MRIRSYRTVYNKPAEGGRIDAVCTMVFVSQGERWHLQPLYIFRDGMIDCLGFDDLVGFNKQVRSGRIATCPPEGARVVVSDFVSFTATGVEYQVGPEDLIKEVADEVDALCGNPTSVERCQEAWGLYDRSPSEENRRSAIAAYESVPLQKRPKVYDRRIVPELFAEIARTCQPTDNQLVASFGLDTSMVQVFCRRLDGELLFKWKSSTIGLDDAGEEVWYDSEGPQVADLAKALPGEWIECIPVTIAPEAFLLFQQAFRQTLENLSEELRQSPEENSRCQMWRRALGLPRGRA
jgi:hypothetical protein